MNNRREFIKISTFAFIGMSTSFLFGCNKKSSSKSDSEQLISLIDDIGPLSPADENGLMLPDGFSSRIIAQSGSQPHIDSPYIWHDAPDGGAIYSTEDKGWVYVSNSEIQNTGGVGAIRFDSEGNIIDAYSILENTNRNCAGGTTPWNTWLSCEETSTGKVFECDPFGLKTPISKPALGVFKHEAVAFDPNTNILYLTEDRSDGCFYRFVPDSFTTDGYPDFNSGSLEVAIVDSLNSIVSWSPVSDPSAVSQDTRYQVQNSTDFNGGEGIVFYNGLVSFVTKGDNKIWEYNTESHVLNAVYDASTHPTPVLTGVDNIALSKDGELIVAEDGGDLQLVTLTKTNKLVPIAQLVGHDSSEVTGPAFSPDGKRLYFSSQRGTSGVSSGGITYEIVGPFHS